MRVEKNAFSKGLVHFAEFPAGCANELRDIAQHSPQSLDDFIGQYAVRRFQKGNLVFNFPREQYAKLDRGETPETINAAWLTLSTSAYNDPSVLTVSGESLRVHQTTQVIDPANAKNTIVRFILDVGQFVGSWATAILIGGSAATATTGTGKIVAAVNSVEDDLGQPLVRTGSTIHLVQWTLKHLDSSEV